MPCWTKKDIVYLEELDVGDGFIPTYGHQPYKIVSKDEDGIRAVDKHGSSHLFDLETDVVRAERCPTCRQIKLTGIK